MKKYIQLAMLQLALLSGLTACVTTAINYFDAATYTQLTSLKAETMTLLETFDAVPYAENTLQIAATRLNLRKAYEYEKGKGELNVDTRDQLSKIMQMFATDVTDYQQHGPAALGPKYFQQAATVLGQAFDIAIATESLKNKQQRQEPQL